MARLSRYLIRLFVADAMTLFAVAALLLYLFQCLRRLDIVAAQGQSILTLLGQAALGMPAIGMVFLYVCLGIGLGRALRDLQGRSELQIIHVGGLAPALWRAVGLYLAGGTVAVLFTAHILDPLSVRTATGWTASIAADIVSRSVVPHRFVEAFPGVTIVIGSRDSAGNIGDFFADDHREGGARRTYFAKSALLSRDAEGYVLRLNQGAIQVMPESRQLAQIAFDRYDLPLGNLAGSPDDAPGGPATTPELVQRALASGTWSAETLEAVIKRTGEGLRVIALGLFVAALSAFPSGRRRRELPIEFAVLAAAFLERAVSSYVPIAGLRVGAGSLLLLLLALALIAVRLGPRRLAPVGSMAG